MTLFTRDQHVFEKKQYLCAKIACAITNFHGKIPMGSYTAAVADYM